MPLKLVEHQFYRLYPDNTNIAYPRGSFEYRVGGGRSLPPMFKVADRPQGS